MDDDTSENAALAGTGHVIFILGDKAMNVRWQRQQGLDESASNSTVLATAAEPESGAHAAAAVPPDALPPTVLPA